ncbi:uncharacterized protein CEXT_614811 [Caerostris extrusa]|uniref:Uncharacterized protein n=1 Tax=Caerostris extrusa TaxID=172846 RepID=A0AAV4W9Z3_CAEEX|nr:uncharacterized protein CEXT_614811 [Caerostris extrusa]
MEHVKFASNFVFIVDILQGCQALFPEIRAIRSFRDRRRASFHPFLIFHAFVAFREIVRFEKENLEQSMLEFRYIRPGSLFTGHHFVSSVGRNKHFGYSNITLPAHHHEHPRTLHPLPGNVGGPLLRTPESELHRPARGQRQSHRQVGQERVPPRTSWGFEHHFPHFHGGHHLGGYGHHKEFDHYLIPLLVVLGLGVLVMPLLSVFMTTLVGNVPVTTLVSGRKKREVPGVEDVEEKITEIFKRFGRAFEAFNQDSKDD